ncbi:Dam family site-specific DNA-(adenine-N6)-methyltransferase [Bifidobacterium cuniculi]|uniref:Site-specific DNA-methyltransferase (adenine-specific) n=1 Tax=Bifidobacterium cuniculi TaxID=1688 RepID=A0A087AZL9_9BIFI|nr:Dam family site-specific DNA-(adenine-N6)-methyltransferase [Bifidobacterium cuniculi]KFI64219.1 DNA adenine methylase [Bifidobacterium cuniculi]
MGNIGSEVRHQFLDEVQQDLLSILPVTPGDIDSIVEQFGSFETMFQEGRNDPRWKLLKDNLRKRGMAEPEWWRTPLGRFAAQNIDDLDVSVVSCVDAAKILGVTKGTVSTLVRRGTLASRQGQPYLSAVLGRMLHPKTAGRPRKVSNDRIVGVGEDGQRAKPILKWAGGKTQMLGTLLPLVPQQYGTYIEPFFGGGALFFALCPNNAVIADSNPELVNLYVQVRDHVDDVIEALSQYRNDKELFLSTRALDWQAMSPIEAAARTLFLNKTCFNGLYRVNRKGQFNTPFGSYKNPTICDPAALREASGALSHAVIECGDYLTILKKHAKPGDFIFLDPPYIPVSKYADFKRYTKEQFGIGDHSKLAIEFMRLYSMGCQVVLTNSNHPLVHELYSSFKIQVIPTRRSVSCKTSSRGGEDVVVSAFPKLQLGTSHGHAKIDPDGQTRLYPATRFMGSKQKLLNELWDAVSRFEFDSVADLFSGSGVVSYMFKARGKQVFSNDYMAMSATFTKALVENNHVTLPREEALRLLEDCSTDNFVESTFKDLYYSDEDNHLIDVLRTRIKTLEDPYKHAIAMMALIRACTKKRPRGIFTYTGQRYDDGRQDLRKSLSRQFLEAVDAINAAVFDNGKANRSVRSNALKVGAGSFDLVYIDPPYYSPLSDNEYVRRYHFVEGLACDWQGVQMQEHTKTKKFKSYPTPFSSRTGAAQAFDELFKRYAQSILIVSYSSNSLPTKEEMVELLRRYKRHVEVVPVDYRYSFGTQHKGSSNRNQVQEYFFVAY